jgi:hypothetical protein
METQVMGLRDSTEIWPSLSMALITVLTTAFLASVTLTSVSSPQHTYLGIRFEVSRTDLIDMCKKKGIAARDLDSDTVSAPHPLEPLGGAREVKFFFRKGKLYKMAVSFEVPPPEPTAARLLAAYETEHNRLSELFGPSSENTTSMNAPTVQDRYEWLLRGQAYKRSIWAVNEENVTISLWLYGGDEGIVLTEVYEKG